MITTPRVSEQTIALRRSGEVFLGDAPDVVILRVYFDARRIGRDSDVSRRRSALSTWTRAGCATPRIACLAATVRTCDVWRSQPRSSLSAAAVPHRADRKDHDRTCDLRRDTEIRGRQDGQHHDGDDGDDFDADNERVDHATRIYRPAGHSVARSRASSCGRRRRRAL